MDLRVTAEALTDLQHVRPYLKKPVEAAFVPGLIRPVKFHGELFKEGMRLQNLPSDYTQGPLKITDDPTTAEMNVTAPDQVTAMISGMQLAQHVR